MHVNRKSPTQLHNLRKNQRLKIRFCDFRSLPVSARYRTTSWFSKCGQSFSSLRHLPFVSTLRAVRAFAIVTVCALPIVVFMAPSSATTSSKHTEQRTNLQHASCWFAADPSKAYYERFSLVWAPLSMLVLLAGVFGTELYKHCDRDSFLAITVLGCLPGIIVPILIPCQADRGKPYAERFWVKASTWIAIFGFYANYFWTHYFYQILGAEYLFDTYRLNDVPLVTFTATFFYFTFYFTLINIVLRRVSALSRALPRLLRSLVWWNTIFVLSYGTAIFEAVSIQHFPLYTYKDRNTFLVVGSVVYGLYFIIGFPAFFSIDEEYCASETKPIPKATLWEVSKNALAATAIVSLLLDLWRLCLGSIYNLGFANVEMPFVYQQGS